MAIHFKTILFHKLLVYLRAFYLHIQYLELRIHSSKFLISYCILALNINYLSFDLVFFSAYFSALFPNWKPSTIQYRYSRSHNDLNYLRYQVQVWYFNLDKTNNCKRIINTHAIQFVLYLHKVIGGFLF